MFFFKFLSKSLHGKIVRTYGSATEDNANINTMPCVLFIHIFIYSTWGELRGILWMFKQYKCYVHRPITGTSLIGILTVELVTGVLLNYSLVNNIGALAHGQQESQRMEGVPELAGETQSGGIKVKGHLSAVSSGACHTKGLLYDNMVLWEYHQHWVNFDV